MEWVNKASTGVSDEVTSSINIGFVELADDGTCTIHFCFRKDFPETSDSCVLELGDIKIGVGMPDDAQLERMLAFYDNPTIH